MDEPTLKNYSILTSRMNFVPMPKLIPLIDPVTFNSLRVSTVSKVL